MHPRPLAAVADLGLLGGVLLWGVAAGCVTQTVTPVAAPLWQPGTYRSAPPATKRPPRRSGSVEQIAVAPAPPPGAATAVAPTDPSAEPPASAPAAPAAPPPEDAEGQLRLLTPAEPELDPAPAPLLQREPATPPRTAPTPPRVRQFFAYSALYGAGRCHFASCAQAGWNTPHADGESDSRCHLGDCLAAGWTTTHPDGTTAETRCLPGGCLTAGWSTTDSASSAPALTRCLPGGCRTTGWSTHYPGHYPGGAVAETRCLPGGCPRAGWSTRLPSGEVVDCRCILRDCEHNGAECR